MKEVIDFITRKSMNISSKSVLEQMVDEYRVLQRQLKKIEEEAKITKEAIIAAMGDDTEALDGEGLVIATLNVQTREVFDKGSFEAKYPQECLDFYKTTEFKVLRLK